MSPNNSPSSIYHLPSTHAADVHGRPRKPTESDGRNILANPSWFPPFRGILCVSPHNSPSSLFHLPPTHAADVHGIWRKLVVAIYRPRRPIFCHLGWIFSVFLIISQIPSSIARPHAAEVHGRPWALTEADGRNTPPDPPLFPPLRIFSLFFRIISQLPSSISRPHMPRMSTDVSGS